MIGVPGTAHRLFGALREDGISVILISQGSSEHSICFAVPEAEADRAERVVRRAFDPELREGQIQSVEIDRRLQHPRRGRRRHGRRARHRGAGVPGARFRGRQRACDRAGRLRTQHLGRDRRTQQRARAARRPRGLLPVAAHGIDRPRRPRSCRLGASRPAGDAGRAAAPRPQSRPARARDRRFVADGARAGSASASAAGAPRTRRRRCRSISTASRNTCTLRTFRTP